VEKQLLYSGRRGGTQVAECETRPLLRRRNFTDVDSVAVGGSRHFGLRASESVQFI